MITPRASLIRVVKALQFAGPWRKYFLPRYTYFFTPRDLWFLCSELEGAGKAGGVIVEAGCAHGATAVYLNNHMNQCGLDLPYYCIDTFEGFIEKHAEYEQENLGKDARLHLKYNVNSPKWLEQTMEVNLIDRVKAVKADVGTFDYASLGTIAFCLLDVDLYIPTRQALPKIWQQMKPGSVLIVDDCVEKGEYEGAFLAYVEFADSVGHKREIVHGKFGVLRK